MFEPGMVLCTRNGQRCSNAVVVGVDDNTVTLLTDFGNTLKLAPEAVNAAYEVSESWTEYKQLGGEYPTIIERIEQQLDLLTCALAHVKSL